MARTFWAAGAVAVCSLTGGSWQATAQDPFPACESQQSLEQIIDSGGELMPDDCRQLTITEVESDGRRLCVVDVSGAGEGVLNALRDAALPEKWWVRCERVSEAVD